MEICPLASYLRGDILSFSKISSSIPQIPPSTLEFGEQPEKTSPSFLHLLLAFPRTFLEIFSRVLPFFFLSAPEPYQFPRMNPPNLNPTRVKLLKEHFGAFVPSHKQINLLNTFLAFHDFAIGNNIPAKHLTTLHIQGGPTLAYRPGDGQEEQQANLHSFIEYLKQSSTATLENVRVEISTKSLVVPKIGSITVGKTLRVELWKTTQYSMGWRTRKFFGIHREKGISVSAQYWFQKTAEAAFESTQIDERLEKAYSLPKDIQTVSVSNED